MTQQVERTTQGARSYEVRARDFENVLSTGESESVDTTGTGSMRGVINSTPVKIREDFNKLHTLMPSNYASHRFRELADSWYEATVGISSPSEKKNYRAYRQILSMGMVAVPFILQDLKDRGGDWYEALSDITGHNPIIPENRGKVRLMKQAWLKWAKEQGYELR